jgi:large subunit ribosomal protein L10
VSKQLKGQMMAAMKKEFAGVGDLLVANVIGLDSAATADLRNELRKRKIKLEVVRNNLAAKVFAEMGLPPMDDLLVGPSAIIWGGDGAVELARVAVELAKTKEKLEFRGACVSGELLKGKEGVETLSKLPSRTELLGQIVGMLLGPIQGVVGAITSPAAQVASQLEAIAEKGAAPAS